MSKYWIVFIMITVLNPQLAEGIQDRNETRSSSEYSESNTSRILQSVRYGMTFGYRGIVLSTGQEIFGAYCGWSSPSVPTTYPYNSDGNCNTISGDTPCSMSLPILCIKKMNFKRPCYKLPADGYYVGWSEGYLQVTTPITGTRLTSTYAADKICENQFGVGYRIAEFHDGRYVDDENSTSI